MKIFNGARSEIIFLFLAVFTGFIAGLIGELTGRYYFFEKILPIPLLGEINLADTDTGNYNVIIRDAKNVVVEQDKQVQETAFLAGKSIVGIYPSGDKESGDLNGLSVDDYYTRSDSLAQGLVLTSDGWIIADTGIKPEKDENLASWTDRIKKSYVVVTADRKIFRPDTAILDPLTSHLVLHIAAKDLPVLKIAKAEETKTGQTLLAVKWDGKIKSTTISSLHSANIEKIIPSDKISETFILNDDLKINFNHAVLVNLSGSVAGLVGSEGKIYAAEYIMPVLKSLVPAEKIKRPGLAINYFDLSGAIKKDTINSSVNDREDGVLVVGDKDKPAVIKNGPADKAGIKAGDVITAIDDIKIDFDHRLEGIMQNYIAGDEATFEVWRGDKKLEIKVIFGENK
jgi:serine protease Do